jgi:triacylglycerol lipase
MTLYAYALIAQEAYTATPDIGEANSASRAIVRETDVGLVVAFPGTDNASCWMADLDALTVNIPRAGQVHRGFFEAWSAIADEVMDAIDDQPVTLVGHSLGAALAICAAVSLTLLDKPPIAVYGFEPPRVSKDIGVRALLTNVPVHLYKNGNDAVPDIPLGWNHAALLTHIGKAALPIPNVEDHMLDRVLAALAPTK